LIDLGIDNRYLHLLKHKRAEFDKRYQNLAEELRPYFLRMYANPVLNKIRFTDNQ